MNGPKVNAKVHNLPEIVFITQNVHNEDGYLAVTEIDEEFVKTDDIVGVYHLYQVSKVQVDNKLGDL